MFNIFKRPFEKSSQEAWAKMSDDIAKVAMKRRTHNEWRNIWIGGFRCRNGWICFGSSFWNEINPELFFPKLCSNGTKLK